MMIFKIILFIFVIGLLFIGFFAAKLIGIFREGMRLFRAQANGQTAQQRQQQQRQNTNQVVVDHRNADDANKKIFKQDEGEYIDFEEEK